ncbi:MAG: hypothetical protein D6798_00200 [Deltaproteobacteria bacterium]|nr:MAG: hypothetical protein D6798_00200 [Deltaproteobacteria bacterium]
MTTTTGGGPWTWVLGCAIAMGTGCTGGKWGSGQGIDTAGDGGGDTITLGDTGTPECGGSPPEISAGPWCEYLGMDAPEPGSEDLPVLRVYATATDPDGDLHIRAVRSWFDGEPLGEIDPDTAEFKEKDRSRASDHDCQVFDTTVSDRWYFIEGRVEWGADYDWGIAVQDAEGNWSEMAITTCAAPTSEGLEP